MGTLAVESALDKGLERTEAGLLVDFVESDRTVDSAGEAITLLCILRSLVAYSGVTGFPDMPSDCFCGARALRNKDDDDLFCNSGEEIRFIAKATMGLLAATPAKAMA